MLDQEDKRLLPYIEDSFLITLEEFTEDIVL